jgi:signal transduction histidine kinase
MTIKIVNLLPAGECSFDSREIFDISERMQLFGTFSGIDIVIDNCTGERQFSERLFELEPGGFDSAILGFFRTLHDVAGIRDALSSLNMPVVEIMHSSIPGESRLNGNVHGRISYNGEISYLLAVVALSKFYEKNLSNGTNRGIIPLQGRSWKLESVDGIDRLSGSRTLMIQNGSTEAEVTGGFRVLFFDNSIGLTQRSLREIIKNEKVAALREFSAGLAHELNNIFAPIVGYAQLILKKTDNSELNSKLRIIERSVFKASHIVNDLFEYTQLPRIEFERVDIHEILELIITKLSETFKSKDITVTQKLHDIAPIKGDRHRLIEVFENLIMQSSESITAGGTIEISAYEDIIDRENEIAYGIQFDRSMENPFHETALKVGTPVVVIKIKDTGKGFEEDELKRVYYPFCLIHYFKNAKRLNLCKSYGIIQNHGGMLNISSIPEKGTLHTVLLPVSQQVDENGK